jgi:predicted amidophosphoribosyltransferase
MDTAASLASAFGPSEAWVPVPPRRGKIRRTGWDQVEAIARKLEQNHAGRHNEAGTLPVRRCLERLPSRSQKELNRGERGKNLIGKIRCVRPAPTSALVFDDVITTGATLNACAGALKKAGTLRVYAIALFYD